MNPVTTNRLPALDWMRGFVMLLGMRHDAGLAAACIAGTLALPLLYTLCLRYRRLKATHPKSLLRYM